MLTCDIGGPSVTGAERVKFSVNRKNYEIELAPELADKLRAEFGIFMETIKVAGTIDGVNFSTELTADAADRLRAEFGIFSETVQVSGGIDGAEFHAALSEAKADDFTDAMAYWIGYARKEGKPADRVVSGTNIDGPRIEIGTDYSTTPQGVSQTSRLGKAYKALRMDIRDWGLSNGWTEQDLGSRGRPPRDLRDAYALHSHHRPWAHLVPGTDVEPGRDEEAALMPAPKRTATKGKAK